MLPCRSRTHVFGRRTVTFPREDWRCEELSPASTQPAPSCRSDDEAPPGASPLPELTPLSGLPEGSVEPSPPEKGDKASPSPAAVPRGTASDPRNRSKGSSARCCGAAVAPQHTSAPALSGRARGCGAGRDAAPEQQ
eukprot:1537859-Alexandrium_andersonii.AAC.1